MQVPKHVIADNSPLIFLLFYIPNDRKINKKNESKRIPTDRIRGLLRETLPLRARRIFPLKFLQKWDSI